MDSPAGPIRDRVAERRGERRYPCNVPGALILEDGGDPMRVVVRDLSAAGALIECIDPHQKPVALAVAFKDLIAEVPVGVVGRRDTGSQLEIRLAFGAIPPTERKALDQILRSLAQQFARAQEELADRPNDPPYYRAGFQWPSEIPPRSRRRRAG
jgi:hypothetical protein